MLIDDTLYNNYRIVCQGNPTAVTSFEDILFPIFQGILQQDIQGKILTKK